MLIHHSALLGTSSLSDAHTLPPHTPRIVQRLPESLRLSPNINTIAVCHELYSTGCQIRHTSISFQPFVKLSDVVL